MLASQELLQHFRNDGLWTGGNAERKGATHLVGDGDTIARFKAKFTLLPRRVR